MSVTCCALSGGDGDAGETLEDRHLVGRKAHACCECHGAIAIGEMHHLYKAVYDGSLDSYRTCELCCEIRSHFACSDGWIFGELWSDLAQNFYPGMVAGGQCMEGLSPAAKERLFERRQAWLLRDPNNMKRVLAWRRNDAALREREQQREGMREVLFNAEEITDGR